MSTLDEALRSFSGDVLLATIDPMDAEQPQDVDKLTEWVGAVDQRLIQASNLRVRLLLSALPRESVDIAPLQGWSNLVLSQKRAGPRPPRAFARSSAPQMASSLPSSQPRP